MSDQKVRVRFAPSPTGALHIGGVRTALYNYLFAKQQGGDILLRIEDTDSQRFVPGAEAYIIEAFNWLGIKFDEGVGIGGPNGPYRQSERREIYKVYVKQLLDSGHAYIAFDTPEELEALRQEYKNFQYDSHTRHLGKNSLTLSKEEVDQRIAAGEKYVVRIKVEPGVDVEINDLVRGKVVINSDILDDKVLYKAADELPTYHLANIVDDHLMKITHVIRGEEWLPSAPLHVLLYRYFGWEDSMPQFAHLPLLLKPEGNGKLSKRDGDRLGFPVFPLEWHDPKTGDISTGYRESGYLPEAIINFLALLGWNPGLDRDIFTLDELIQLFSFEHVSKSGARFDYEKAKWFNHEYMMNKPDAEVTALFQPQLEAKGITCDAATVQKMVALVKNRITFVKDIWDEVSFFFERPTAYDEKSLKKRWKPESHEILSQLYAFLENLDSFESEATEKKVMDWISINGYNTGTVMNSFRITIVGAARGPHMFSITEILGKEETLARLDAALKVLN